MGYFQAERRRSLQKSVIGGWGVYGMIKSTMAEIGPSGRKVLVSFFFLACADLLRRSIIGQVRAFKS